MSGSKEIKLDGLPEFREGAQEFIKELSRCPTCAITLALELADSNDPQERFLLKEVLLELGRMMAEVEAREIRYMPSGRRLPLLEGWIRGEVGLGIVASLLSSLRGGGHD